MWSTPKRFKWFFETVEAAEQFATEKRNDGAIDVLVIVKHNVEDLCRDVTSKARVEGADVAWTEYTTD